MAHDCVTRVWALAIATAACVGLPSAVVYAMVRVAAARRYGATFALALVLVIWVTLSAAYYPRVCADLVPWLQFLRLRRARGGRQRGGGEASLLVPQPSSFVTATTDALYWDAPAARGRARTMRAFPWEAPAERGGPRAAGGADDDVLPPSPPPRYPSYEQRRVPLAQWHGDDRGGRLAALPREPPAARAGADDDDCDVLRPPCERQSDGGPSRYCAICLADVDREETAKRLPLCLHVFHRHCIDQWLRGHSTCPICRCNAFLTGSSLHGS